MTPEDHSTFGEQVLTSNEVYPAADKRLTKKTVKERRDGLLRVGKA